MAILKGGINGPFSGRVGSVIGYELNGQGIIRGLAKKSSKPPTKEQIIHRNKMKLVSEFLAPIKPMLNFGYKNLAPEGSRVGAFQKAQSYTFKNSLDYDPNNDNMPYVNPERVLVFQGDLIGPQRLEFELNDEGLLFRWDISSGNYQGDQLIVVLYNNEGNYADFLTGGADVSVGEYFLKVNLKNFGTTGVTHVYAGFHNPLDDTVSNSIYCGCF